MAKRKSGPMGATTLEVDADVYGKDAMFLRASLANATLDDGRTVDVWHTLNAAIGITITKGKDSRSYVLSLRHLADAVLNAEEKRTTPEGEGTEP